MLPERFGCFMTASGGGQRERERRRQRVLGVGDKVRRERVCM